MWTGCLACHNLGHTLILGSVRGNVCLHALKDTAVKVIQISTISVRRGKVTLLALLAKSCHNTIYLHDL